MDAALAALDEAEVLHRVRDVEPRAVQAHRGQGTIEHLARRADERRALQVLLIARLLADEHDASIGGTAAEDGLGRPAVELAPGAARRRRPELGEARARGNERRGARALLLELQRLVGLRATGLAPRLFGEAVEPSHLRVARVVQEVTVLADEPPEHVVQHVPARGIGGARRLPRQVQELARHAGGTGRRRLVRSIRRRLAGRRLAPAHLPRGDALAQEGAGGRLPALEGRYDVDRPHDPDLRPPRQPARKLSTSE